MPGLAEEGLQTQHYVLMCTQSRRCPAWRLPNLRGGAWKPLLLMADTSPRESYSAKGVAQALLRAKPEGRWTDRTLPLVAESRPVSAPLWLARSAPGVKTGLRNHADEVERPARVRFRDLASANRGDRTAQALASQRACPRRLCAAQTPRRQKPVFICDERNVKKLINTLRPLKCLPVVGAHPGAPVRRV